MLTRTPEETIVCGEGDSKIVFTIVSVRGNYVRVGVQADKNIPIHRGEVYERIHGNQEGEST